MYSSPNLSFLNASATRQPNFIIYGVMKVVITVIVPTIGSRNVLVTPTSAPPFAATRANSPPEEDRPKPVLKDVTMLSP